MKDTDDGITPELLLQAYMSGIFPMAESRDDPELFWVDPRRRGVFPLDGFHISRSLRRALKRGDYSVTTDRDFTGVLEGCADRGETWINDEIAALYHALHDRGHAHSLEVWSEQGALIGGVYGVALGRAFFGESMFSRRRDASKIALAWLVDRLNLCGYTLFDTQFLTPHLASLGAVEIPRARYHAALAEALTGAADFTRSAERPDIAGLLARHDARQAAQSTG
ncbi:leucyl/phenylalanyl-tRNA--protein transferase [Oceanicola sp. S124]|uniref:leucyl/phenylalanyl-tRNA--protein transferase n=1 Tax=Oceanicola sp. S124 TaxID=1042378 RepID=UPI000255851E|nr:leucyl/phenylalanyl-tRNA--protein transferase [Oceanicola sp. S124]